MVSEAMKNLGLQRDTPIDLLLINAPLRDYAERPRVNNFTLPVLGLGYIATYAEAQGFNVGVLDAEATGMTVADVVAFVNNSDPRWVGFNLLAPTYEMSATIAAGLKASIKVILGGHQARALPERILRDPRMHNCVALIVGEAEIRVTELLGDAAARQNLPLVYWLNRELDVIAAGRPEHANPAYLAPDVNALPFVNRKFLIDDPSPVDGRVRASMVGARGCPYDCSFCGAAVSANPDVTIRVRHPENILAEMDQLRSGYGVNAFRFVDDLFLGSKRVILNMTEAFLAERVGEWAVWDATGRINVLDRLNDNQISALKEAGLSEVAVGIESGSPRILDLIDKRIDPTMVTRVVERLVRIGIDVKGYFIFGFPGETSLEIEATVELIERLWSVADGETGSFRASAFEYRPYPGTPDWHRLVGTGRFTVNDLLDYRPVDFTGDGSRSHMNARDEFNFAIPTDLADAPRHEVRSAVDKVAKEQYARLTKWKF
ncbi:B12-binding domain-containing radical SAM protein [Dietzia natronolimnaea]|uniref:B12-binding domain-containing radical SAM protein n=1 Tax=Dietzia natronolimnaea TaxID=161920 RepID=UPI003D101C71